MLNKLRIAQFRFTMTALEEIRLPRFQGNVWRGGFGAVFRRVVCVQPRRTECADCLMRERCAYAYIFATPIPKDAEVLRTHESAPRPFVLEPAQGVHTGTPLQYAPGTQLTVGLTLVGRAIDYLPYFIVVFQELGEAGIGRGRGKYRLEMVHAVRRWTGEETLIYKDGAVRADAGEALVVCYADVLARAETITPKAGTSSESGEREREDEAREITVNFLTPTRLKYEGRYVRTPEFQVVVRGLLRRVSSLYYFHCGARWEADYRGMVDRAAEVEIVRTKTRWVEWERFSRRQGQRVELSGFVGRVEYAGEVTEFLPLLLIGELVHVGKGTVLGNGRYEIERGDRDREGR